MDIRTKKEWHSFCRREKTDIGDNIFKVPTYPDKVYKKIGWVSWGDFLGTGRSFRRHIRFRGYFSARSYVRALGLKSKEEWRMFCQSSELPIDIPRQPQMVYKNDGWIDYYDWLGSSRWNWQEFEKARDWARTLGLKHMSSWRKYWRKHKRPNDIPLNPDMVFKNDGWESWEDWLGSEARKFYSNYHQKEKFLSFDDAQNFAKTLKLTSMRNWQGYIKGELKELTELPHNIPRAPNAVYKNKGWKGWPDFLGYEPKRKKKRTDNDKK